MKLLYGILLFLSLAFNASAEIVEIRVTWNTVQCNPGCIKLLDKYLHKMKEAIDVKIDEAGGSAIIHWKANVPFRSESLREAFGFVGIKMDSLNIKVRGTITHSGNKFYLISIGDNTKFNLLGNIHPKGFDYEATTSPYNRPLTQEEKDRLLVAENKKYVVTIKGPILQPHQLPPLDLIIEDISVLETKK